MPSPEPDADLITLFVAPLNRLGATYMVTGAVAAIVYGEPRLTNDIDLVVALAEREVARLEAAFDPSEFYVPPTETLIAEAQRPLGGHFNVIHGATALKADMYVAGADPLHAWAFERRRQIVVAGETIWLAPPEYVMLRKLQYLRDGGSDKHRRDVRAMLRELGDAIDRPALLAHIRQLGLNAEWTSIGVA